MMKLLSAPPSPFGRKVKIAAALLGLSDRIKVEATDTGRPDDPLRRHNPLGKIPTLVLEDGTAMFDSRVILEYLDHLAGSGKILPRDFDARVTALRLQALCDGMLDALLLQVYERRYRPETIWHQPWLDYQAEKVTRAMNVLEKTPPRLNALPDVGQIALACALGYQDLRFEGRWRATYPALVGWLDRFAAQVPAFDATKVKT
jgi:glutathione S-transferase